jgi:hypothetical protein
METTSSFDYNLVNLVLSDVLIAINEDRAPVRLDGSSVFNSI